MKKQHLLKTMLLLCALIVGSMCAWATDVTFTAGTEQGTNGSSGNPDTMTKSGITISGTSFATTTAQYRIYSGSTLTISSTVGNITQIVLTSTANKGSDNGPDKISLKAGSTGSYTTTTGSKDGTWTGSATSVSFSASAQCRATKIVVTYEVPKPAPSFSLDITEKTLELYGNETVDVTLTTNTDGAISCESDDDDVATVALKSENVYTITAQKVGTATITIRSEASANYSSASAEVAITVQDSRADAGISFAEAEQETTLGESYSGQALTNNNSLVVTYNSTNTDVATVASDGTVTVEAAGETTIKATFGGNATYKPAEVQYTLTVNKKTLPLSFANAEVDKLDTDASYTQTVNALPGDYEGTVTYSIASSTSTGATINSSTGAVTFSKKGMVTIRASATATEIYNSATTTYSLIISKDGEMSFIDLRGATFEYLSFNPGDFTSSGTGYQDYSDVDYEGSDSKTYTGWKLYQVMHSSSNMQMKKSGAGKVELPLIRSDLGFKIEVTAETNDVIVSDGTNTGTNKLTITSTSASDVSIYTGSNYAVISLIKITPILPEVTISAAKYATYCYNRKLDFSETDIKVYTAKSNGTTVQLTEVADGIVPANEGVVLYCETADTYSIPLTAADATDYESLTNEMVGITARTQVNATDGGKTNYILANEGGVVGFYKASDGYLAANKAYLSTAKPAPASAHGFLGFDENTTAIDVITNSKEIKGEYFNLAGQRVAQPTKGLYIVNGKKVIIK